MQNDLKRTTRLVWDLPLRVAHWLLAICIAGSFATHYAGIEWFPWHRRFGYSVLVLTAFRVVWGFVGTRHSRFAGFVRGPRATLQYLRSRGSAPAVGHNPLGAWSVLALLALPLLQASTGLFANDEIANAGPFYGWVSPATSHRITALHHANATALAVLIGLHLIAVFWHVRVLRRPLVRAMLTGRKDAELVPEAEAIDGSRSAMALAILAGLVVVLVLAVRAAPDASISLY